MSNEKDIDETSIREVLSYLISKWRIIFLINLIGIIVISINYKFFILKEFNEDTIIFANLKEGKVDTYFGDYEVFSLDFSGYRPLFYNHKLIRATIDDLGLNNFSIQEFKSSLSVEDQGAFENQTSFKISFRSKFENSGEILNKHLENFMLFINFREAQNAINYFTRKNELNIAINNNIIESTQLSVLYYDSILSEINPFTKNTTNLGNIKSNFVLTKLDLVNDNYIETEKKLINLKLSINDYKRELGDFERNLDSLSKINKVLQEEQFSKDPFKIFNNKITFQESATNTEAAISPNLKKQFIFPILLLFFGTLLFLSLIFILKQNK